MTDERARAHAQAVKEMCMEKPQIDKEKNDNSLEYYLYGKGKELM